MSKFTKELVDSYADKLLIGLTDEENKMVLEEFDVIEESMEMIANIPGISEVEVMSHPLDNFSFVLREDESTEGMPIEDIVKNCDLYEDREIKVPRVVE